MKEVERLKVEMEVEVEELGLGEDEERVEHEGEEPVVPEGVDEPPRSSTPTEVPSDTEPPSQLVIPQKPPESAEIEGTKNILAHVEEDAKTDIEEIEQTHSKRKKSKRKGKPIPTELPTKTEKKSNLRPVPDIASPMAEGSGADKPTDGAAPGGPQTELSKREKRRLREAKKVSEGRASNSQICNVCKEQFESKTKLFAHINDTGHALASASAKENESDRTKRGSKGKR